MKNHGERKRKELCLQNKMDIRQSSSTGSTKTERFHKRSQIITDHLANQPLWGVTCQSHTKTHIYADETSSFKTCFSSCLHSSLQFWLSPQKGLPPKIETCDSWVSVNNGACDLCFFSFQDPKFLSQKKIPRIVHPSASDPFGDHRVSSLWHHQPHRNESIPRSQHTTKNPRNPRINPRKTNTSLRNVWNVCVSCPKWCFLLSLLGSRQAVARY